MIEQNDGTNDGTKAILHSVQAAGLSHMDMLLPAAVPAWDGEIQTIPLYCMIINKN